MGPPRRARQRLRESRAYAHRRLARSGWACAGTWESRAFSITASGGDVTEYGYSLSSEEHRPERLAEFARQAEESGFSFALISDHYHPWLDKQGQSGFVWSVLGAIATRTERLRVGTGVTCPIIR